MKQEDLIMVRLSNDPQSKERKSHFNTWFRVMFIDSDETFIGRVEKIDRHEFELLKIGEDVRLNIAQIQHVFKDSDQFCYGDDITICECTGLCRNK